MFSALLIASFILLQGVHKFKFVVDGVETVDRNAPLDENKAHNVMNVKKSDFEVFEALAMDLASNNTNNTGNNNNNNNTANAQPPLSGSPPGSYTQEIPSADGSGNVPSSGPPFLPPHLLQVILNNPSTNFGEPTLLPQPNHVMLNHLYALSIKVGPVDSKQSNFIKLLMYNQFRMELWCLVLYIVIGRNTLRRFFTSRYKKISFFYSWSYSPLADLSNSLLLRYLSRLDGFNLLWEGVFCLFHVKIILGPLSPTVKPVAQCDDGKWQYRYVGRLCWTAWTKTNKDFVENISLPIFCIHKTKIHELI